MTHAVPLPFLLFFGCDLRVSPKDSCAQSLVPTVMVLGGSVTLRDRAQWGTAFRCSCSPQGSLDRCSERIVIKEQAWTSLRHWFPVLSYDLFLLYVLPLF